MATLFLVWAIAATAWACISTLMIVRNPFPFPDRGHRVFGVRDEKTRVAVVKIIENLSGKKALYTFDSGDIHQTILADGYTSIHYIDDINECASDIPANAISIAVENPEQYAEKAISLLEAEGYEARIIEDVKTDLPVNYLVPVKSNAFLGWALVFRRPLLKMPKPKFRSSNY